MYKHLHKAEPDLDSIDFLKEQHNQSKRRERNPNLFPRRGGLRLPELTLREGDEEVDLDRLEPERERDLELDRDEDPEAEGERRPRLGFAMGRANRAKARLFSASRETLAERIKSKEERL